MIHPALVLSVGIERPLPVVARYLSDPANFPQWAAGLAEGLAPKSVYAHTHAEAAEWVAATPQGEATIRFSLPNEFGIADHWVQLPDGALVYVPLRAVANGDGSEVSLTLFRLPGMDEAHFAADAESVRRDLMTLKRILEAGGG